MNIARVGLAGALMTLALNVWAGPGSPPAGAGVSKMDATGTWNATIEGRGPPQKIVLVLKQDKKKLTGTMSTNGAPPVEITDGKALRTTVYFSVEMTMPAMPGRAGMPPPPGQQAGAPMKMVTKYEGTVDGDTMTIETKMGGMGGMGGGMGGMGGPPPGGGGDMGGGGGPPPGGGGGMGGGGGRGMGGGGMGGGMGMGGMNTKITATRAK